MFFCRPISKRAEGLLFGGCIYGMINPAVSLAEGDMTPVVGGTKTRLGLALDRGPVVIFDFNTNFRRRSIKHRLLTVFDHLMVARH